GGQQEARRSRARSVGRVVVLGQARGARQEARGAVARSAALPGDRSRPPQGQADDTVARGVPRRDRRSQAVALSASQAVALSARSMRRCIEGCDERTTSYIRLG